MPFIQESKYTNRKEYYVKTTEIKSIPKRKTERKKNKTNAHKAIKHSFISPCVHILNIQIVISLMFGRYPNNKKKKNVK